MLSMYVFQRVKSTILFCIHDLEPESFRAFLEDGGFPVFLGERHDLVLQELLRDVVLRDVAVRHGLRETRHVMNLILFLLANTGQPLSFQNLTKNLAFPTVGQTSRYMEFLQDAYLIFTVPKYSASFKQRVIGPAKYFAIDNGLRRANSPQVQPDLGHRLENAVALHLRREMRELCYAGARDLWECDFITPDAAIQVCLELTPANLGRELRGVMRLQGMRRALVVTLDQSDQLREDGVDMEVPGVGCPDSSVPMDIPHPRCQFSALPGILTALSHG
jgi:uncharacterized protein